MEKCITYLFQHEGKSHTEEFWQFIFLLCTKLYEERTTGRGERRFHATAPERATSEEVEAIYHRIASLYREASQAYPYAFAGRECTLFPRTVAYIVNELQKYKLSATLLDPFSVAYQQWASVVSRSSRGQFFSPLSAALYTVRLLDPQEHERVLDYTCGGGVFIGGLYAHRAEMLGIPLAQEQTEAGSFEQSLVHLRQYMQTKVYGAEIDPLLVEVSRTQMAMTGGAPGHIYRLDSLAFPEGDREDAHAQKEIPLGSWIALLGTLLSIPGSVLTSLSSRGLN